MSATRDVLRLEFEAGFIFVNGIRTTEDEGNETRRKIENIIQQRVAFHHNDSAVGEKVAEALVPIITGVFATTYSFDRESQHKGSGLSRGIGVGGVSLIGLGVNRYATIQDEKNDHARQLADQIKQFFEQNPGSSLNLILHSQGADIGKRALALLSHIVKQERVRVISLGGMVAIPEDECQFVLNIRLNHDLVPLVVGNVLNYLSGFIDGRQGEFRPIINEQERFFAHSVDSYLEQSAIQDLLKKLAEPDYFTKEGDDIFRQTPVLELQHNGQNLH